jgi:hypothetical protein
MMNNVGGSPVHYAGHWPRYKPVDFRKGTEHGLEGTIDWPISVVWEPHENDIALSKYGIDRIFEATRGRRRGGDERHRGDLPAAGMAPDGHLPDAQ